MRFTTIVMLSRPPVVVAGPVPPASPPGCPGAPGRTLGSPAKLMRLEWARVAYKALSASGARAQVQALSTAESGMGRAALGVMKSRTSALAVRSL